MNNPSELQGGKICEICISSTHILLWRRKINAGNRRQTSSVWENKTKNRRPAISLPEPANFLRRMLDENKGSGKDQLKGDSDWLSEMQCNIIRPLLAGREIARAQKVLRLCGPAIVLIYHYANLKAFEMSFVNCFYLMKYLVKCFFLCCSVPSLPRLSLKNVFHRSLRLPDWLFLSGHVFTRPHVLLHS